MASTYTLNNGIELIGTGEQSGTWGDTTNTNFELLDTALDGQVTITAAAAGNSGSPNSLPITDGSSSNGRNRLINITSGSDLGATVYYQLTPNDAEKIVYIKNSLNTQNLIVFQGTYNSSNDYEIKNGTTAVVFFNGAGSGAVAANILSDIQIEGLSTATAGTSNLRLGKNAGDAIVSGGNYNVVVGDEAGTAITTGDRNTAVGFEALKTATTAQYNTAIGYQALEANTGNNNTAVGDQALEANIGGANNSALGDDALVANTTGASNVGIGASALAANTTASGNTAVGYKAGFANTTGSQNTVVGSEALDNATTAVANTSVGYGSMADTSTGSYNTAVGSQSLLLNTTGTENVAVGYQNLDANTTGTHNTSVGNYALGANTTASNSTAVGYSALTSNTTGAANTGFGRQALTTNTTASYNTAVGYQAGLSNTTGNDNTFLGAFSGYSVTTGTRNTYVGKNAGYYNTTATGNTLIGHASNGSGAGQAITTGSNNTVIGGYNGNQNSLDIRTSSNYIVLSDGAGNHRMRMNGSGLFCSEVYSVTGGATANVYVDSSGNLYRATSSLKYKTDVQDAEHGLADVLKLRSVIYKSKKESESGITFGGFIAEEVHEAGLTEFVQYAEDGTPDALAYSNMVSLCIKAIQEQQATITALEARITALENA